MAPLILAAGLTGAIFDDMYWTHRFQERTKELWATGQLVTLEEVVNRWKSIPEKENAALVYLEAYAARKELPTEAALNHLALAPRPGAKPSEETLSLLQKDVAANAGALRPIRQGSALARSCYPLKPSGDFLALLYPHIEKLRSASWLCGRAAVLRATAGDGGSALKLLADAVSLGRSIGDHTPLFGVAGTTQRRTSSPSGGLS